MDIDGEGRIYQNGTNYQYDYYLKDHLGSTRMVINDQNQITEAFLYHPYGTIVPMEDIATSPQTSTRQQFTGKEYDNEGEVNGVGGIDAYYFGARMYDPEVGIWLSTDPEDQYWNAYSYCGYDPINSIDATGQAAELIYELPKMVVTASRIGLTAAQAAAITTALTTMSTLYLMYEIVKPVELGNATLTGNQYDWADQFEQNISLNENAQAAEEVKETGKSVRYH